MTTNEIIREYHRIFRQPLENITEDTVIQFAEHILNKYKISQVVTSDPDLAIDMYLTSNLTSD